MGAEQEMAINFKVRRGAKGARRMEWSQGLERKGESLAHSEAEGIGT